MIQSTMPILDVEVVGPVPESLSQDLARRIADAAGEALQSRPQGTWVRLRFLSEDAYAENGSGPGKGLCPVLVSLLESQPPTGQALSDRLSRLTVAIAGACGRPAHSVHIVVEPAAAGRVSFGGKLFIE